MAIEYIDWNRNGLCGAACAHMVLRAHIATTPTTQAKQEDIWTNIKDRTDGRSTRQCSGFIPEPYPNMIRESCDGGRVFCWETYPNVLSATVKALLGRGVKVRLRKASTEGTATGWIKSCVQGGRLAIVLVDRGKHWVVVDGWDETQSEPVSMLDPALGDVQRVPLDTWSIERMLAVDCGKFNQKYVVVEVG